MTIAKRQIGDPAKVDVKQGGVQKVADAETINFAGAGVTVTPNGTTADVDIPGGGGGSSVKGHTYIPVNEFSVVRSTLGANITEDSDVENPRLYREARNDDSSAGNQEITYAVEVRLGADFAGWAASNPISLDTWSDDITNNQIKVKLVSQAGTTDPQVAGATDLTDGDTVSSWTTHNSGTALTPSGTYNASEWVRFEITLSIRTDGTTSKKGRFARLKLAYA